MSVRLLQGDCRAILPTLPAASVHCVVTSPPYWGLRDYGVAGQLGLEPTPEEYVARMVEVFREVRRVLRDDGTLWLNMGDSYASGSSGDRTEGTNGRVLKCRARDPVDSLKPKDLVGMPWRLAFALQADGWYLRADIVWSKPNPMPESVTDRPTKAHEYVFLLTKSARYFWDADAVREPAEYGRRDTKGEWRGGAYVNQRGAQSNSNGNGGNNSVTGAHPETGRNLRSVWTIPSAPFPDAHFATFPHALASRCIQAGTSERGACGACGAPWVRDIGDSEPLDGRGSGNVERKIADGTEGRLPTHMERGVPWRPHGKPTVGWSPGCSHAAPPVPCTVLDPFGGSGTVGAVAEQLGRHSILIELSPAYCAMARERTAQRGLFAQEA